MLDFHMTKILIGTNSEYKVNAIKRAIYNLDINVSEFKQEKVSSNISDQPMKAGETKQGSINRARNAHNLFPDYDLAIGVEFGYEPVDDHFNIVCWASIVTKDGKVIYECTSNVMLRWFYDKDFYN